MKKILLIITLLSFIPVSLFSKTIEMANKYIKIIGDINTGQFLIKTVEGDENLETDQNVPLLYESNPPYSFTTIRIDEKNYKFGSSKGIVIQKMIQRNNTLIYAWSINNIGVIQKLKFITGPTTGNKDTVEILYKVQNKGKKKHNIGVRIMLDAYLGEEDGALFRVPVLGPITTETSYQGYSLPEYWYSYDDLIRPTVRAQGTLQIKNFRKPDRVIFANTMRFVQHPWDFKIEKSKKFERSHVDAKDSAIGIFWEPKEFNQNDSIIVKTYYGIYGSTIHKGKVYNVSLSGPVTISGDSFFINADIQNTNPFKADDVMVKIMLPKGLKLFDNEILEKSVGTLEPKEIVRASWNVIPDETVAEEVSYKLNISGKIQGKESSMMPEVLPERKILIRKKGEKIEIQADDFEEYNIELSFDKKTEQPYLVFTKKEDLKTDIARQPLETKKTEKSTVEEPMEKRISESEKIIATETEEILKTPKQEKITAEASGPKRVKTIVLDEYNNVLFKYKKSYLTRSAKRALDKLGDMLKEDKIHDILIQGHTDNIGGEEYNLQLSEARARNVTTYVINKGYIHQDRVIYEGKGKELPVTDNSTSEGRQRNRRVEIHFLEK